MVGLERKVEVDGSASGRVTEGLPVVRDGIPGVLDTYVIPRWCEGLREVGEGRGEDKEHREHREHRDLVAAHD